MSRGGGYPIEEFLEAITAQLDKTQDALRLKSVNRPLTFALKDFNVDLKVFVEMDTSGRVAFRPSGPNEEGASNVSIGFTTITRPMIEENTISLEMTQAPTLEEIGLNEQERRRLEKIGVRNAAQLRNLQRSAGEDTMSRHTGVNLTALRSALDLSRPRLEEVSPENSPSTVSPTNPADSIFNEQRPRHNNQKPPANKPKPESPAPSTHERPDNYGSLVDHIRRNANKPGIGIISGETVNKPVQKVRVSPDARKLRLGGRNLIDVGRIPRARLNGVPLNAIESGSSSISFALPSEILSGQLSVEMPDGDTELFDLVVDHTLSDGEG